MLQLVWKAVEQIKQLTGIVRRYIYVVCNDTMVENPVITEYVYRVFLPNIKDKSNLKSINKFLGFTEKEGISTARSLEKIEKGQAVSNMKEFSKGELIKLNQFVKY